MIHNLSLQVNQGKIANTLPGGYFSYGWNESLWTLELEFLCYLLLAALSVLGLLKRRSLVAVIAAIAWIAEVVIISTPSLARNFTFSLIHRWDLVTILGIRLETMKMFILVPIFLSGALLYLYREKMPDSGALALGATILFLAGFVIPLGHTLSTDQPGLHRGLPRVSADLARYPSSFHESRCCQRLFVRNLYLCVPDPAAVGDVGNKLLGVLPYTLLSRSCGDSPGGRKLVAHREARPEAEGAKGTKAFPIALNLEIEHVPLTFTRSFVIVT